MIEVAYGHATHVGRVRHDNEDSRLAGPGVFVVADGMGGHAAGDLASATAVEVLSALVGQADLDAEAVRSAVTAADERVRALTGEDGEPLGAGTTLAGIVEVRHEGAPMWLVVNVGDSRVYRLHDGELAQISVDHSLVQELVDSGALPAELARLHPQRNVITRALGTAGGAVADYWLLPPTPGERLMMCSDGLTNELDDDELLAVLRDERDPAAAAQRLVDDAVASGGRDNVTVVVVDVLGAPSVG